ncbi:MAG: hypothetical protein AAFY20_11710 [Cyanobacteria bacterium J06639_14]
MRLIEILGDADMGEPGIQMTRLNANVSRRQDAPQSSLEDLTDEPWNLIPGRDLGGSWNLISGRNLGNRELATGLDADMGEPGIQMTRLNANVSRRQDAPQSSLEDLTDEPWNLIPGRDLGGSWNLISGRNLGNRELATGLDADMGKPSIQMTGFKANVSRRQNAPQSSSEDLTDEPWNFISGRDLGGSWNLISGRNLGNRELATGLDADIGEPGIQMTRLNANVSRRQNAPQSSSEDLTDEPWNFISGRDLRGSWNLMPGRDLGGSWNFIPRRYVWAKGV